MVTRSHREGLAIPTPILVYEREWGRHGFDRNSALKAMYNPPDEAGMDSSYDYFINMDNIHLKTHLKVTRENLEIVKSRWQVSMVLIGMALLNGPGQEPENDDAPSPGETVSKVTAAIGPVLLPLIEHLGGLSAEDVRTPV